MNGDGKSKGGILGRLLRLEVISGTDPESLEEAYEEWREAAEEKRIEPSSIAYESDGTNLYMFFLYAE